MYRILEKKVLNPTVTLMRIEAPLVARKAEPGQFIILRTDENGERIPLTIADFNRETGSVTIIFQTVGATTKKLSMMNAGDSLQDFVGPLGRPTDVKEKRKVAVVGGGVIAVASAIMFFVDSSSGGTDIIALIVKKFSNIKIGRALLITDVLIVVVGGLLSGLSVFIPSVVGLIIKTLGIDLVIFVIKSAIGGRARRACAR